MSLNPYCNGYSFRTLYDANLYGIDLSSLNPYCNGYSFRTNKKGHG